MAFCRALLRNRSRSSVWQYAAHRSLVTSAHPVVSGNDGSISRLKEYVKTTLPWNLDEVGERPVTTRKEMTDVLHDSFGSQVKSLAMAVLRTCPFAAAVLPAEYVAARNKLWVVYTMTDDDFLGRHLWQQREPQRPRPYVHEDWLELIEVQDFCRSLMQGDARYAEALVSPYANRVLTSKDWGIVCKDSLPRSSEFVTPMCLARTLETINSLRSQIDFDKQLEQGVAPPLEHVERWCTIFRLLHNVDNGLSGRPLVGFHDFRTKMADGSEVAPFVENKVEILSLLAYKEGIMSDGELDSHLRKMLLMHDVDYLCKPEVRPSSDVLSYFYTYLLLARVEGWHLSEDDNLGSSHDVKRSVTEHFDEYYSLKLEEAARKADRGVQAAEDKLQQETDALLKQQADDVEVQKERIELMEVVWGDEKELALDEVIRRQEREGIEVLHPLKMSITIAKEEEKLDVRMLEAEREQLQELLDQMHVLMLTKPRPDTQFIIYRYPLARQIVSVSQSLCEDESDVFNGIQVLSAKPAGQRVLACNVTWFLRNLPHHPVLVEALLSQAILCTGEFKKLTSSIEKSVLAALCKNIGVSAMEEINSADPNADRLKSHIGKLQQAHDLVSKKPVQHPADTSALPESSTELTAACRDSLGKLEALCLGKLADANSDLSAVSQWLKSAMRLTPAKRDHLDSGSAAAQLSEIDQWLVADIPTDTRLALEAAATHDVKLLAGRIAVGRVTSSAPALLDSIKREATVALRDKVRLPTPVPPPEEPVFSYPEWWRIRKRRREEAKLVYRLQKRGRWRGGRKMLRCGWFLGMKRPPVDFKDAYDARHSK